jgi:hypothetical protein
MFRRMMQKSYFPCQDGELDAAGGRGAGGVGVSRVWALFTGDSRVRAGTSTPGLGIFSSNHAMHSVDALTNPCAGAARRARGGRRRARVGRRHSPNGAGGRGARGGAGRAPPNPPPPPRRTGRSANLRPHLPPTVSPVHAWNQGWGKWGRGVGAGVYFPSHTFGPVQSSGTPCPGGHLASIPKCPQPGGKFSSRSTNPLSADAHYFGNRGTIPLTDGAGCITFVVAPHALRDSS